MAELDITQQLVALGMDESTAEDIQGKMNGNDFMKLVDALGDPVAARTKASAILGKYGVKLGDQPMNNEGYLGAKYKSIREGEALDETFGGLLTRLGEGFSYSLELSEQNRDRVLDWLDENAVNYDALSATTFRINCEDRDAAYRTGRGLSGLLGKPTVRDSVEIEEKMGKKSDDRRVRDAKAKMAEIKPRNPVVKAMAATGKKGSYHTDKDARKDAGRKAKYKPRFDEEIEETLSEGVMGMNKVNPLFRLRELAGLPIGDMDEIKIQDAPTLDPNGVLAAGPVGADPVVDADVDGMGADPVADPMADMDGGMDDAGMEPEMDMGGDDVDMGDDLGMGDLDAGVPGDIGSDPIEAPMSAEPVAAPSQSDAMAQIEDALNSIQSGLADIRLSEYKSLIKKLQDLTNQAQMMGRDYLGERRKK